MQFIFTSIFDSLFTLIGNVNYILLFTTSTVCNRKPNIYIINVNLIMVTLSSRKAVVTSINIPPSVNIESRYIE